MKRRLSVLTFVPKMKPLIFVSALLLIGLSGAKSQASMSATVTKTINIQASSEKVWDFVNDLSRWKNWAIHNVYDSREGENDWWLMDGPRGTSRVRMNGNRSLGILDHEFIDPGEGHWTVPCRVVSANEGAHFMITFTKPVPMPDEAFEMGMKLLDEELQKLKAFIETN